MNFKIGEEVRVWLPKDDITVTPGMMAYNGQVSTISKRCRKKSRKNNYYNIPSIYGYELEGMVSEYGIPYTFLSDFLFPTSDI